MSYNYEDHREALFTDQGQRDVITMLQHVESTLEVSGAIRMQEALSSLVDASWHAVACVDRLHELGLIREIPQECTLLQNRVFVGVAK